MSEQASLLFVKERVLPGPRFISISKTNDLSFENFSNSICLEYMKKYNCVYFAAIGGAGALIAKAIKSINIVCYEDLGPEAVRCIEVENFPAVVAIDSRGKAITKSLILP